MRLASKKRREARVPLPARLFMQMSFLRGSPARHGSTPNDHHHLHLFLFLLINIHILARRSRASDSRLIGQWGDFGTVCVKISAIYLKKNVAHFFCICPHKPSSCYFTKTISIHNQILFSAGYQGKLLCNTL